MSGSTHNHDLLRELAGNGRDGCIASHARGAARAGATKQEAAEAIGVTFLMHGGPATVYGARAYAAFCEFTDGTSSQPR